MKIIFKIILVLIVILISTVVYHVIRFQVIYIDETITSGEGYGFKIGDTKEQAYHKAAELLKGEDIYFLNPLYKQEGQELIKQIKFDNQDYEFIKDRDVWDFHFKERKFNPETYEWEYGFNKYFCNSIRLKFKDGRLVEIHRHRQTDELP